MSLTSHLTFNLFRLSDWTVHNPGAARAATLALAVTAALAALLFNTHLSWACPTGGGGCGG